jgi:peptide/nickel transport system ATP-binding protein
LNKDLVLEIKDLTFFYKKDNPIYNNFSLELKKGELVTIFGKSGSGKTTLFELILGTLKPINGTIEKSDISMIFQDPYNSFHPTYNIFEQIKDAIKNDYKK